MLLITNSNLEIIEAHPVVQHALSLKVFSENKIRNVAQIDRYFSVLEIMSMVKIEQVVTPFL